MRIPGLKTARTSLRWLRSLAVQHGLILGYHRVTDSGWDPFALGISPRAFAAQLEVLRRLARPMAVSELVDKMVEGRLPPRSIALTFDDGYSEMLHAAAPLLETYDVPATLFVVTETLGREFWWDELARLVAAARHPDRPLGSTVDAAGEPIALGHGADDSPGGRQRLALRLYRLLRTLASADRRNALDRLRQWADGPPEQPTHRALERGELVELAAHVLMEIGAHSASHPLLSELPTAEQRREVRASKLALETLLAREVQGFSFPNGSFSRVTLAEVEAAGFAYACSSTADAVRMRSNRFCLPRLWVSGKDGPAFERWLRRWIDA